MKNLSLIVLSLLAVVVGAADIPLGNPDFKINSKGVMPYWVFTSKDPAAGTVDMEMLPNGKGAVKISSHSAKNFFGIIQHVSLNKFPQVKPGEKLKITLSYKQKNEDVERGGFVNMAGYGSKGRWLDKDSARTSGSFDWKDCSFVQVIDGVPAEAKGFFISLYLGKTTGTVWFSEPKIDIEVVK